MKQYSLTWLSLLNKYAGKYELFSPKEVDYADSLEKEWKEFQPRYSFLQLLEIFPEIKKDKEYKQQLEDEIKQWNQD